jgi:steroid delta-isomerase-like uncharacterized protein
MSTEINKAVAKRWIEAFNSHDLSAVEECISEDYINFGTTDARGYEAGRAVLTQLHEAAPDAQLEPKYVVAEDDLVMMLLHCRGTHTGPLQGIPATGKQFEGYLVDVFRFKEGKMIEGWVIQDRLSMAMQLGLLPQ